MKRKVVVDMIDTLLQERREAENEKRQLLLQIEDIRRQQESLSTEPGCGGRWTAEEMDDQISRLTREIQEQDRKLTNICAMARFITTGD